MSAVRMLPRFGVVQPLLEEAPCLGEGQSADGHQRRIPVRPDGAFLFAARPRGFGDGADGRDAFVDPALDHVDPGGEIVQPQPLAVPLGTDCDRTGFEQVAARITEAQRIDLRPDELLQRVDPLQVPPVARWEPFKLDQHATGGIAPIGDGQPFATERRRRQEQCFGRGQGVADS